jgi:hypothetical protein
MKRLLGVLTLIVVLSLPCFAGHTLVGGSRYSCDCGTPGCLEDYPGECGNSMLSSPTEAPTDNTVELGIALVAIMLWLRLKA